MAGVESAIPARAIESLRAALTGTADWEEASRRACALVGADAGAVIAWRKSDHGLELLEHQGYDGRFADEYTAHYFRHDLLMDAAEKAAPNEWIVSDEIYPWNRFGGHVFFGDFLTRHRVNQIVALVMALGEDRTIAFTFARHTRQPVRAADFARGDVATFARAACEVFAAREQTVANARQSLQDAFTSDTALCLLVDAIGRAHGLDGGRVAVGAIGGGELILDGHRLRHRDPLSNDRLTRLVAAAQTGRAAAISLRAGSRGTVRVDARPAPVGVKLAARQALAFVRIERRESTTRIEAGELQLVFGLTPAQARVLALLCEGLSASECSNVLDCGMPTIRTHIAQLMERMGCRRQTQLVRAALLATTS